MLLTRPVIEVLDSYGDQLAVLDILPGSTVTDDRTQANRRSCDLKIADPNAVLAPSLSTDMLATGATSGNVIRISQGGNKLGTFVVQVSDTKDSGDQRTVELTGYDRSWLTTRLQIPVAWVVGAGTPWTQAFVDLMMAYYPLPGALGRQNLNYLTIAGGTPNLAGLDNLTWPTPAITLNPGDEPWTDMATQWAPAVGRELYYGPDDVCYLKPVPDPRFQNPSWQFTEGDDCHMTAVEHQFDDNAAPNVFQRDGVGPGNSVISATYADENPWSSSYIGGGYGCMLNYEQNTLIASQGQCDSAAQCAFFLGLGANEPVTITCIPNPALQVGQLVWVTRVPAGLGAYGTAPVVMDTIVHAFYPGETTQVSGRLVRPYQPWYLSTPYNFPPPPNG